MLDMPRCSPRRRIYEAEANSLMGCLRVRLHALTKRIQIPCMSQQQLCKFDLAGDLDGFNRLVLMASQADADRPTGLVADFRFFRKGVKA